MNTRYRARAARTGVQNYGDHVEERDASEVFAAESMATWIGAPVTVGHAWINAENVHAHAVGFVRSVARDRGDGDGDGIEYVSVELVITHPEAASRIDRGDLVELSGGYSTDLVDGRQTNIRVNHVALLPKNGARCGNACAIAP